MNVLMPSGKCTKRTWESVARASPSAAAITRWPVEPTAFRASQGGCPLELSLWNCQLVRHSVATFDLCP